MSEHAAQISSQVPDQQLSLPHQQETEFFSGLTLLDVYGREEIVGESWTPTEGSKEHYYPKIPILAYWFPHVLERKFIKNLTTSVADDAKKPVLLEVGCGSGFVSKLLAADRDIAVVGVDSNLEGMEASRVPQTQGDVRLINSDVWDILDEFGPKFDAETHAERQELLEIMRLDTSYPNFRITTGEFDNWTWQSGNEGLCNQELERLQQISKTSTEPSQVDVVLCSFMHQDRDLTIPIREGISPKAIVYVRPVSGMAGAGDYYIPAVYDPATDDVTTAGRNVLISYNPGVNYTTTARWLTRFRSDWYDFFDPPEFIEEFGAEVIVQLRNDLALGTTNNAVQETKYNFDEEFERSFKRVIGNLDGFKQGISQAEQMISPKA